MRRRSALVAAVVGSALLLSGCVKQGITPQGRQVHHLYNLIFLLAAIVFGGVVLTLLVEIVLFRKRDDTPAPQAQGRPWMVASFFIIGLALVSILFPYGEHVLANVDHVNRNPTVSIKLEGFQWQWTAYYQNEGFFVTGKTLKQPLVFELPVDEPVQIELDSRDVMHEFYVPSLLFMRNALPGHPNVFTFTPTRLGTFAGQCAQFCGLWHSRMTFTMKVVPEADYVDWVKREKRAVLLLTCPVKTGSLSIVAHDISWNTNCLNVAAGGQPRITVANEDEGINHNFAIYDSPDRHTRFFQTGRFAGVSTQSFQLPTLPPGKYYFQCDVHGPAMSGVFIVTKPGG